MGEVHDWNVLLKVVITQYTSVLIPSVSGVCVLVLRSPIMPPCMITGYRAEQIPRADQTTPEMDYSNPELSGTCDCRRCQVNIQKGEATRLATHLRQIADIVESMGKEALRRRDSSWTYLQWATSVQRWVVMIQKYGRRW